MAKPKLEESLMNFLHLSDETQMSRKDLDNLKATVKEMRSHPSLKMKKVRGNSIRNSQTAPMAKPKLEESLMNFLRFSNKSQLTRKDLDNLKATMKEMRSHPSLKVRNCDTKEVDDSLAKSQASVSTSYRWDDGEDSTTSSELTPDSVDESQLARKNLDNLKATVKEMRPDPPFQLKRCETKGVDISSANSQASVSTDHRWDDGGDSTTFSGLTQDSTLSGVV